MSFNVDGSGPFRTALKILDFNISFLFVLDNGLCTPLTASKAGVFSRPFNFTP